MKYAKHTLFVAGLAALAFPASAIQAPPDDEPRVAPKELPRSEPAPKADAEAVKPDEDAPRDATPAEPEKMPVARKTAYFGVGGAPVPEVLGVHLALKPGEGVWVQVLDPNGPATKAGFSVNDVITKIDGQSVGSQGDLTSLVTKKNPGDEITIDFVHTGKPETRKVILGERAEDAIAMNLPRNGQLDHLLQGMPQDQAKRLRELIERNVGGAEGFHELGPDAGMPEIDQKIQEMQKRVQKMLEGAAENGAAPKGRQFNLQSESTVRVMDGQGSVEVKNKDGGKQVRVLDKAGNVTWSGSWETEQDKAAAPPDVRKRVEALNLDMNFKGGGLRLNFGAHAADPLLDE